MTDEVRYRLRQQAAVAELGQRALVSTDMRRLMQEATALVAMGLSVEFCKVLELQPDGKSLLLKAGVGWKEGLIGNTTVGAGGDSHDCYT
ncbi:MAG: histidine kinase, partial [Actinomycetota bacterium]